jgi:hypothetical protein
LRGILAVDAKQLRAIRFRQINGPCLELAEPFALTSEASALALKELIV